MIERTLLECAAKAANLTVEAVGIDNLYVTGGSYLNYPWNPLVSDGDALRLAVLLKFSIRVFDTNVRVQRVAGNVVYEQVISDPMAATRRAIVRAAAELITSQSNNEQQHNLLTSSNLTLREEFGRPCSKAPECVCFDKEGSQLCKCVFETMSRMEHGNE